METKTIEFTKQEATAMLQLIDAAVKTLGLQAAEAGVHLSKKLNEAFQEEVTEEEVTAEEVKKDSKKSN